MPVRKISGSREREAEAETPKKRKRSDSRRDLEAGWLPVHHKRRADIYRAIQRVTDKGKSVTKLTLFGNSKPIVHSRRVASLPVPLPLQATTSPSNPTNLSSPIHSFISSSTFPVNGVPALPLFLVSFIPASGRSILNEARRPGPFPPFLVPANDDDDDTDGMIGSREVYGLGSKNILAVDSARMAAVRWGVKGSW